MIRALFLGLFLSAIPLAPLAWAQTETPAANSLAGTRFALNFTTCGASPRISCVADGDTIWLNGTKIRIADINTPEVSHPACTSEAALGARATMRLTQLLNAGPFSVERQGSRDTDRYGRALRIWTRDGVSLGDVLVREGLAERWTGKRRDWCAA